MKKFLTYFLLIALTLSPAASAQEATSTSGWAAVKEVAIGNELIVHLKDGKTVKGKLGSVSEMSLTISQKNRTTDVDRGKVQKVYQVVSKSAAKPALIGAGIGGGTGVAAGAASGSNKGESGEPGTAVVSLALGAAGAGVGALIGYLAGGRKKQVLIYEAQ